MSRRIGPPVNAKQKCRGLRNSEMSPLEPGLGLRLGFAGALGDPRRLVQGFDLFPQFMIHPFIVNVAVEPWATRNVNHGRWANFSPRPGRFSVRSSLASSIPPGNIFPRTDHDGRLPGNHSNTTDQNVRRQ